MNHLKGEVRMNIFMIPIIIAETTEKIDSTVVSPLWILGGIALILLIAITENAYQEDSKNKKQGGREGGEQ